MAWAMWRSVNSAFNFVDSLKTKKYIAAAFSALLLTACSSVDLDAAKKLGATGVTTATALRDDSKDIQHEIAAFEDRDTLFQVVTELRACEDRAQANKTVCTLKASDIKVEVENKNIAKLSKSLAERTKAFEKLLETYTSFEALATYEASAEAEKAVGGLIKQVNSFITAVNVLPATAAAVPLVTATAGEIAKVGVSLFAEEKQKKEVMAASKLVREAVTGLRDATAREKEVATSLRVVINAHRNVVKIALMKEGVVGYSEDLKGLIEDLKLTPTKDMDAALSKSSPLKGAMIRVLEQRAEREDAEISSRYQDLLTTLSKLIQEHEKLEQGKPLDLAALKQWAEKIEAYYKQVKQAQ